MVVDCFYHCDEAHIVSDVLPDSHCTCFALYLCYTPLLLVSQSWILIFSFLFLLLFLLWRPDFFMKHSRGRERERKKNLVQFILLPNKQLILIIACSQWRSFFLLATHPIGEGSVLWRLFCFFFLSVSFFLFFCVTTHIKLVSFLSLFSLTHSLFSFR